MGSMKNRATLTIRNMLAIEQYKLEIELRKRFKNNVFRIEHDNDQTTITLYKSIRNLPDPDSL